MNNDDFIHDLDDKEIDMMLKYVPEYTADNARNIKNKFAQKAKIRQREFSFKKLALVSVVASMIFVTTLVFAEVIDISKIYRIIFGENSKYIEQYIEPLVVEKEAPLSIQSEYDGIVIKLISALNDENVLRIFATVTDTEGDRLGEDLEFTSWGLDQGHGGNVSIIDYNNTTKTATVMITSLGNNHQGSATLTVNGFSTGREFLEDLPERNINIGELLKGHTPKIISQDEVWKRGGGGYDSELYEESRLLKSDEIDIKLDNVDMFSISNIGFVDGLFHIQAKAKLRDAALVDGYYINTKLVNTDKEIVYDSAAHINFITDKKYAYQSESTKPHDEYSEIIYDTITKPEQLNDLSLTIDYMKSPKITEGKWEFSFMIPKKVTTEFYVGREMFINGIKLKIDRISLSPIGITIHLPHNISADYNHGDVVNVEYMDGTIVELNQSSIHTYEDESTIIFGGDIIELEKVQGIIINSERININDEFLNLMKDVERYEADLFNELFTSFGIDSYDYKIVQSHNKKLYNEITMLFRVDEPIPSSSYGDTKLYYFIDDSKSEGLAMKQDIDGVNYLYKFKADESSRSGWRITDKKQVQGRTIPLDDYFINNPVPDSFEEEE